MAAWMTTIEPAVLNAIKGKVSKGIGSSDRNRDFVHKELVPQIKARYGGASVTIRSQGPGIKPGANAYIFQLPDAEGNTTVMMRLGEVVQHIYEHRLPIKALWDFAAEIKGEETFDGDASSDEDSTDDTSALDAIGGNGNDAGAGAGGGDGAGGGAGGAAVQLPVAAPPAAPQQLPLAGGRLQAAAAAAAAALQLKRTGGAEHNSPAAAAAAGAGAGAPAAKKMRAHRDDLLSDAAGGRQPEGLDLLMTSEEDDQGEGVGQHDGPLPRQNTSKPEHQTPPPPTPAAAAATQQAPATAAAAAAAAAARVGPRCSHCDDVLDGDTPVAMCEECGQRVCVAGYCAKKCRVTGVAATSNLLNKTCSHCGITLGVLSKTLCTVCRTAARPCLVHHSPACRKHSE